MAGFGGHSWVDQILPKVIDRLAGTLKSFQKDRIFQSLFADQVHVDWPVADRFITLKVLDFPVNNRYVDGGGDINTPIDSKLIVTAFVRLEADPEFRSSVNVQDEARGVYKLLQQICSCLQMWDGPAGTADAGLQMLTRPMRLSPGFRIEAKSGKDNTRWTVCPRTWELPFVANLGEPYPD